MPIALVAPVCTLLRSARTLWFRVWAIDCVYNRLGCQQPCGAGPKDRCMLTHEWLLLPSVCPWCFPLPLGSFDSSLLLVHVNPCPLFSSPLCVCVPYGQPATLRHGLWPSWCCTVSARALPAQCSLLVCFPALPHVCVRRVFFFHRPRLSQACLLVIVHGLPFWFLGKNQKPKSRPPLLPPCLLCCFLFFGAHVAPFSFLVSSINSSTRPQTLSCVSP